MRITWSPLAIERVAEISAWTARDRPLAAERLVEKLAVQPHPADLCYEAADGYERSTLPVADNAVHSVPFIIPNAGVSWFLRRRLRVPGYRRSPV